MEGTACVWESLWRGAAMSYSRRVAWRCARGAGQAHFPRAVGVFAHAFSCDARVHLSGMHVRTSEC